MILMLKGIKRYIGIKVYIIFAVGLAISVLLACFMAGNQKTVAFTNNGEVISVITMKTTVGELLGDLGVVVRKDDYLNIPQTARLADISAIEFKKAVGVKVQVDGKSMDLLTVKNTVREALAANSITFSENDKFIGALPGDKITAGMKLTIVRVKEDVAEVKEPIPFNTVRNNNNFLAYGNEKVITEGKNGLKNLKYSIRYEDGVETSRTLIGEEVLEQPVTAVIERGTILTYNASRGDALNYSQVLDMTATAYNCPDNIGITYTGRYVKKGIVAVDPNVIPLGSLLYVEVPGGEDYGYAIAADIGGAIIGSKIDVYIEDYNSAIIWGITNVRVYILQ